MLVITWQHMTVCQSGSQQETGTLKLGRDGKGTLSKDGGLRN